MTDIPCYIPQFRFGPMAGLPYAESVLPATFPPFPADLQMTDSSAGLPLSSGRTLNPLVHRPDTTGAQQRRMPAQHPTAFRHSGGLQECGFYGYHRAVFDHTCPTWGAWIPPYGRRDRQPDVPTRRTRFPAPTQGRPRHPGRLPARPPRAPRTASRRGRSAGRKQRSLPPKTAAAPPPPSSPHSSLASLSASSACSFFLFLRCQSGLSTPG